MTKVYLAAPFFYPAQLALVEQIEQVIEGAGYELISPRRLMVLSKDASPEDRGKVWEANVAGLESADIVIAQIAGLGRRAQDVINKRLQSEVDRLKDREKNAIGVEMGVRASVRLRTAESLQEMIQEVMSSSAFPAYADEGTLWEIGYASALRRQRRYIDEGPQIILYAPDQTVRINVMLTGDANEVVVGPATLLLEAMERAKQGIRTPWKGQTQ